MILPVRIFSSSVSSVFSSELCSRVVKNFPILELYCARFETWNFKRAKTAIIDDRKLVHISNIDQFTIVDYSEFSRGSKSKFQAERSITSV